MMNSCLFCFCKHISTALTYENESILGYPLHKWLAVGELCAAENEVLKKFPELASTTREYRKAFMEQGIPIPTIELLQLAEDLDKLEKSQSSDMASK